MVGDIRIARPGFIQQGVEVIADLEDRGVRIFGQDEVDRQPAYAAVMGNQTPGNVDGVQSDRLDSLQVAIIE